VTARVEVVRTNGIFSLDGEDFEVENNIWLVGDDDELIVIDAAHDARPIAEAVGGRKVLAIVCTHGHNDHVNAAVDLAQATSAPVALHPADAELWEHVHGDRPPDRTLADGEELTVAGSRAKVLHTPGHTWGGVSILVPDLACVFSGDTLFHGGPGATGRSYADHDTLLASIRRQLLPLPPGTVVHTGHGEDTTIGAEAPGIA
jgi:glyoxylase-like metal-dependent hydrolase (beta-lactamase superfamily II)